MPEKDTNKNYDDEPVEYCKRCYSLKIRHEDITDTDCCMDCGSTEVAVTDIATWERLYEGRYGHKFVQKSADPRASIYFKMSIGRLKSEVFHTKPLQELIHDLYPHFPQGLGRSDSVILLFDRLITDNRLDDLRLLLYKENKK